MSDDIRDLSAKDLRSRVRSGVLRREQVELAAWLGHEGAREMLARSWEKLSEAARSTIDPIMSSAPVDPDGSADLAEWVVGISHWDDHTCARAGLAAACWALPSWEREFPADDRPRRAIEAARTLATGPRTWRKATREAREAQAGAAAAAAAVHRSRARFAALAAQKVVDCLVLPELTGVPEAELEHLSRGFIAASAGVVTSLAGALAQDPEQIRRSVRGALLPFVLHEAQPPVKKTTPRKKKAVAKKKAGAKKKQAAAKRAR